MQGSLRPTRLPRLRIGSKPVDGGNYIFTEQEKAEFLKDEPDAEKFFRPYIGSKEFLQGGMRYILHLADAEPSELVRLPNVKERIKAVRTFRTESTSKPTQAIANTPRMYHVNVVPTVRFMVVPKVSSERREYIPIGWLKPPTIASDLLFVLPDATKIQFAFLSSSIHMAWMRQIGGRLESRYRYSIGLVYNTFPLVDVSSASSKKIEQLVDELLETRSNHTSSTLSDLYDPDLMPPDLRKAHDNLDAAVEKLYKRSGFSSEREQVEHLFGLYEKEVSPMEVQAASKKKGRRKRK